MRSILIAGIVFALLPIVLFKPHVGILLWTWLSYMNPHRLTFGFAYDFPFAYVVAVTTIAGGVFTGQFRRFPVTGLIVVWLLFIAWMCLTTAFAMYPAAAFVQLDRVAKIQLMTFVTILLMYNRERVNALVWVMVLSLGFFGVKGGIFTILTAGEYRVWGPPGSYIEGNNEIALALLMILPLMQYLRMVTPNRWLRLVLLGLMVVCGFSVLGSQSRGALVCGCAMAAFLLVKAKSRWRTGLGLLLVLPLLVSFMPQSWFDRMRTIEQYEADASATSRLDTWQMATRLANDRPLGGGFDLWTQATFDHYSPGAAAFDAHSIYFKVLGEHGWIGLLLFVTIGILAWRAGTWTIRHAEEHADLHWLSDLARMCQVSVAAFATGGAFLSLSYFDLYWHLVAILVIAQMVLRKALAERRAAGVAPIDEIDYPSTQGLTSRAAWVARRKG